MDSFKILLKLFRENFPCVSASSVYLEAIGKGVQVCVAHEKVEVPPRHIPVYSAT